MGVRDRLQQNLNNFAFQQGPVELAQRRIQGLLRRPAFPAEQRLEELRKLTLADMDGENRRLLNKSHIEALIIGNIAADDAAKIATVLNDELWLPAPPNTTTPQ